VTYVVDTHALIWHLTNSSRIGNLARQFLLDSTALLIVPAIALAEIRFLSQRGRMPLIVNHMPAGLNIHDALICATALFYRDSLGEDVQVVTRDEKIAESQLVETVW